MDLAEKARLEKLLGMLGSSFDGERANAARMIAAMAEKKKLTIPELIFGASVIRPQPTYKPTKTQPSKPPKRPKSTARDILQVLADIAAADAVNPDQYGFVLTEWECQFSKDVSSKYSYDYELSEKQIVIAEKVIRKVELYQQSVAEASK
jgi:hypothetical protein